jgi:hypothetical protein
MMRYLLISNNGKKSLFYIKECAEMYRTAYGGVIIEVNENENEPKRIEETPKPLYPVL